MAGDPIDPVILVPIIFVAMPFFFAAILWVIAQFGWRRLADAYLATSDPPPSARRVHWTSMSFGFMGPSYSSCVNAWLTDCGIWLRPTLPFRLFHPMLFIPWAKVEALRPAQFRLFGSMLLELAGGAPTIRMAGRLGRAAAEAYQGRK